MVASAGIGVDIAVLVTAGSGAGNDAVVSVTARPGTSTPRKRSIEESRPQTVLPVEFPASGNSVSIDRQVPV